MDLEQPTLDRALARIKASLHTLAAEGHIAKKDIDRTLKNIQFHTICPPRRKRLILSWKLQRKYRKSKRRFFPKLDARLAIRRDFSASNTSSLDVFSIISISNPSRVVAAHFSRRRR